MSAGLASDRAWRRLVFAFCLLPFAFCLGGAAAQDPMPGATGNAAERYRWFYQQRAYPHERIPEGALLNSIRQLDRLALAAKRGARAASATQWTMIGPQPTGATATATSGRVTALAVDPRNPDVVWLGAAEGGIWKTTDAGQNWAPLTDHMPSLAIGSLAIDPSAPDTLYAGTGEANNCGSACYLGVGLLKTTDGGASWRHIPGQFAPGAARVTAFGALAVHPTNSQIVLAGARFTVGAATGSGIYRSTDAGETWTRVYTANPATEMIFHPTEPDTVFAAVSLAAGSTNGVGVFRSTDAGVTWRAINGSSGNRLPLDTNAGRIALAMARSNPLVLYAGIAQPSGLNSLRGIFKTTDGGETWNPLPSAPDYCNPQCWYNNVLVVDPQNPDVVYAGGIAMYRSTNGGATWSNVSTGADRRTMHVDQHAFAWHPESRRLYVGNDGGAYSTLDGAAPALNWTSLNDTLAITQFYPSLSFHPADANISFGGTQDNGTQRFTGDMRWSHVGPGCDGGWTAVDPSSPNTVYGSCQRVVPLRSTNGGNSFSSINRGLTTSDCTQFISPLVIDPGVNQRVYFGTWRLYQSNDGGGSWSPVSPNLTNAAESSPCPSSGSSRNITTIAPAPSDSRTVYIGTANGRVLVTTEMGDRRLASWTDRTSGLPQRFVTQIVVDPQAATTVYVTTSGFTGVENQGHVFRSTNGGASWTDISGDLPNTPANDLVVDPDVPGQLFLATDIGVFASSDNGVSWAPFGEALPRVAVASLRLHRPSRTLRAATQGRSMWDIEVPLPAGRNPAPGLTSMSPLTARPGDPQLTITINGAGFLPGARVLWNGQERAAEILGPSQLTATISPADFATPGIARVAVANPAPGGGPSNVLYFTIAASPAVNNGGVVHAASFSAAVAAGSIASVFGTNLAFSTALATAVPLPLVLGNISARVNAVSAPLVFVSPQQINLQIPWEAAGQAILTVTAGAVPGPAQSLTLAPAAPGIFTATQTGAGQGAIVIANTATLADGARPARRGEVVSIFCTGLGPVTNRPATGVAALGEVLSRTQTLPDVTVGGLPAEVSFSGLAPGFVGLYQVNVKIPDNAPAGAAVPVELTILGVKSNSVTIAVQ